MKSIMMAVHKIEGGMRTRIEPSPRRPSQRVRPRSSGPVQPGPEEKRGKLRDNDGRTLAPHGRERPGDPRAAREKLGQADVSIGNASNERGGEFCAGSLGRSKRAR